MRRLHVWLTACPPGLATLSRPHRHKQVTTIEGLEADGRLHPVQMHSEGRCYASAHTAPGNDHASVALLSRIRSPAANK